MELAAYLDRIHYDGPLKPDLKTLVALHRAHLHSIPYENLDIHLGRTLPLDQSRVFDKLVTRRRGGWCYEMNGLLAWALREIGFQVTLLASAVGRETQGSRAERNHLIMQVMLDRPYLVDVGFGNGLLEPVPLEPGTYTQGFLDYRLERDGERWIFHNHAYGGPGFDFTLEPRALPDFADRCHYLQTAPESGFVRAAVCHFFRPEKLLTLRGAVLRTMTGEDSRDQTIESEDAYRRVLEDQFDLHLGDDLGPLWQTVWQKHLAWLATGS